MVAQLHNKGGDWQGGRVCNACIRNWGGIETGNASFHVRLIFYYVGRNFFSCIQKNKFQGTYSFCAIFIFRGGCVVDMQNVLIFFVKGYIPGNGFVKYIKKKQCKGSYTVEAAILMPCVVLFLIAMIYTFFFFHDLLVVQAQLSKISLYEDEADYAYEGKNKVDLSEDKRNENEIENKKIDKNKKTADKKRQEQAKKKSNERTVLCNLTNITVKVKRGAHFNANNIVEYEGTLKLPLLIKGVKEWVQDYIHQTEYCKVNKRKYNYCQSVRRGKELLHIVN